MRMPTVDCVMFPAGLHSTLRLIEIRVGVLNYSVIRQVIRWYGFLKC